MGDIHENGGDKGASLSDVVPRSDYMGMIVKMMAELKGELKEAQARMDASLNAHYEDLNMIREEMREGAQHIESGSSIKDPYSKKWIYTCSRAGGHNGREGNYGWQYVEEHGWGNRFGNGYGEHDYARGGNHRRRNHGGNDWQMRGEPFGGDPRPRFDDPSKAIKYIFPEFHGKFDLDAYLEWESQVSKIFALYSFFEFDKVKIAITEFPGKANTWWNDMLRRRRMRGAGEVSSWEELCELLRATFVPKSYYIKLRGELRDLRQGTKSVVDYYYELLSLMSKVGVEESEAATPDWFIHGLYIHLKHKLKVEALRGINLSEVFGFAETFERQGKELALSKAKLTSSQPGGRMGTSKWSAPPKKLEGTPPYQVEDKKVQCFKCKGYGHYAPECPNQRVMVIWQDGSMYSEDEMVKVRKMMSVCVWLILVERRMMRC